MSRNKRRGKKEYRQPDAFQTKALTGFDYVEKNKNIFIAGGVLLLLVILGIWGVTWYQDSARLSDLQGLATVDEIYTSETKTITDAQEKLREEIAEIRGETGEQPGSEKPKTLSAEDKKKIADLEKKIEDMEPDHSKSAAAYLEFYKKNKNIPEGYIAALRYSSWEVSQKRPATAKKILTEMLASPSLLPLHQVLGRSMLVAIMEDEGDTDGALQNLEKMLADATAEFKPKLLLTKTRILLEAKRQKEAEETLNGLIKEHGTSPEADKARGMKALLN